MADLVNWPVIEWVLTRTMQAQFLDDVVLATSDQDIDDPLARVADRLSIPVVRGSEADVLGRYAKATKLFRADTVVRICGDRPLVDPGFIDSAISFFADSEPDLAFNHISEQGQNWPRGFGVEVLAADQVLWMDQNALEPDDREHVTFHMWQNRSRYQIVPVPCPEKLNLRNPDVLFDLDWEEDLLKLNRLCAGKGLEVPAHDVVQQWLSENFS